MRGLTALALIVSAAAAGPAWAAADCSALLSQGCTCAVSIVPGASIGEYTQSAVGTPTAAGFTPTSVATQLYLGGSFTSDDATFITAGPACQDRQLLANTTYIASEINGCACVHPLNTTIATNTSTAGSGVGMALGLAGVGAGAAAVLLVKPASP